MTFGIHSRLIRFVTCWAVLCIGLSLSGFAQEQKIADSLTSVLDTSKVTGNERFKLLSEIVFNETKDLNKALTYADELIKAAGAVNDDDFLRSGYYLKGTKQRLQGHLDAALKSYIKSAEIAKASNNTKGEGEAYSAIGDVYAVGNHADNSKYYHTRAIQLIEQSHPKNLNDSINLASVIANAADAFLRFKSFDTSFVYLKKALAIFNKGGYASGIGYCLGNIGIVYANQGKTTLAEKNLSEAISILEKAQDYYPISAFLVSMADIYAAKGDTGKVSNYLKKSLDLAQQYGLREQIRDADFKLSEFYERNNEPAKALSYYKSYVSYRDSINNISVERNMANQRYDYEMSQKEMQFTALERQKRNEQKLTLALCGILALTIILLLTLHKNNRNKQKAFAVLSLQKQETEKQRAKAEDALLNLQVTQEQLIQSAKMASLGELTAGIAHEIQNPLNFVNNFSDVSIELLSELQEIQLNPNSNIARQEADPIFKNLADNLRKISYHGKRADSIVKGMLQHSRTSTGKKEPTNINDLVDEFLRLSYHGMRGKEKDFNVKLDTNYDRSLPKIRVVPQDISRVLVNLFNNAFYAIFEKKQHNPDFEPTVSVTTHASGTHAEIIILDNGMGIPQAALNKIFHPFFTTKPTGQGTGLGLSLSYDVIKVHGGDIKVDTREGEFTKFTIRLPMDQQA